MNHSVVFLSLCLFSKSNSCMSVQQCHTFQRTFLSILFFISKNGELLWPRKYFERVTDKSQTAVAATCQSHVAHPKE